MFVLCYTETFFNLKLKKISSKVHEDQTMNNFVFMYFKIPNKF